MTSVLRRLRSATADVGGKDQKPTEVGAPVPTEEKARLSAGAESPTGYHDPSAPGLVETEGAPAQWVAQHTSRVFDVEAQGADPRTQARIAATTALAELITHELESQLPARATQPSTVSPFHFAVDIGDLDKHAGLKKIDRGDGGNLRSWLNDYRAQIKEALAQRLPNDFDVQNVSIRGHGYDAGPPYHLEVFFWQNKDVEPRRNERSTLPTAAELFETHAATVSSVDKARTTARVAATSTLADLIVGTLETELPARAAKASSVDPFHFAVNIGGLDEHPVLKEIGRGDAGNIRGWLNDYAAQIKDELAQRLPQDVGVRNIGLHGSGYEGGPPYSLTVFLQPNKGVEPKRNPRSTLPTAAELFATYASTVASAQSTQAAAREAAVTTLADLIVARLEKRLPEIARTGSSPNPFHFAVSMGNIEEERPLVQISRGEAGHLRGWLRDYEEQLKAELGKRLPSDFDTRTVSLNDHGYGSFHLEVFFWRKEGVEPRRNELSKLPTAEELFATHAKAVANRG